MESIGKPVRTRVFRAGNSRAVRIPRAFALPEGEVMIERREGGLFISALRGRWDLFFAEPGVEFPYTAAQLCDRRPPRAVNLIPPRTAATRPRRARRRKP